MIREANTGNVGMMAEAEADREFPDQAKIIHGMEAAMKEAREAYRNRTYPIGAVIVNPNGKVIGYGRNQIYSRGDYTSHAEVEAIHSAGSQLMKQENFGRCTLYTTMEPCLMCSGAILLAHIRRVVWLISNADHGALTCLYKDLQGNQKHLLSPFYQNRMNLLTISCIDEYTMTNGYEGIEEISREWKESMTTWMNDWLARKESSSPEELLCRENFLQRLISSVYTIMPVLKFSK